jgi:alanyl-tRNA synthetase
VVARARALEDELKILRGGQVRSRGAELAAGAVEGRVVARVDGLDGGALRELALAVREQPGVSVVVLGGSLDGGGVSLVAAVTPDGGVAAGALLTDAAKTVGGGAGKQADIAVAGGRKPEKLDEALEQVRAALSA